MSTEVFDQEKPTRSYDKALTIAEQQVEERAPNYIRQALENDAKLARMNKAEAQNASPDFKKRRLIAAIALAAGLIGIGANEASNHTIQTGFEEAFGDGNPQFSQELNTITIQDEKIWDIAGLIDGSDKLIDRHDAVSAIESLPENKEALKDGLKPGDQIYYPDHVDVG